MPRVLLNLPLALFALNAVLSYLLLLRAQIDDAIVVVPWFEEAAMKRKEYELRSPLLFEVDRRKLKTMVGRRVVRRRALADAQRLVLERLIKKSGTVDIDQLTRERLERSIRTHEEVAEFLTFAAEHLAGGSGKQRLTASELQVLDLMPAIAYD